MARTYTAKDITVLEGLEPVRRRPGMYIGGTDKAGLHHLLWELVDNAIDEAMNGHADRLIVTLHRDGETLTVSDNGRGIPVDRHARYKKSALELILTTLHAGGKFEAANYYHSGGLHGVGASVVNALSDKLVARVKRDGAEWEQTFSRGEATGKLRRVGGARGSGTTITFHPDPKIFPGIRFDARLITARLQAKAYLHKGLEVVFKNEEQGEEETFRYTEGLRAYIEHVIRESGKTPVVAEVFSIDRPDKADKADRSGTHELQLECVLTWTESPEETVLSYVNSVPTPSGGAHENGFKGAVVKAVRNYLSIHNLVPRGLTIAAEDAREGMVAVLSCFLPNPQFQGQTKEKLGNPEVASIVDGIVRSSLENYLLHNKTIAEAVAQRVILAARARTASRAAAQQVQRKGAVSHRLNLPGKLADCTSTDPSESELFIVEGDSAGGSAKQARDRKYQAILPLRGKVLNTEQAATDKVLTNKELSDLVSVLGCGAGKDLNLDRLRYHKVCLLMDADADGHHICTLLLTFFYRHLPQLIEHGYVYIAQPPLYRIDVGKTVHWALDDAEKERVLKASKNGRVAVTRFKGLGEMNPPTLKETTLDPTRRSLLRVTIGDTTATDVAIRTLMGRDVAPRFEFIMERAPKVSEIDV
jgi:DNA gyrase subunit B/topoisomerase-4 subunit B